MTLYLDKTKVARMRGYVEPNGSFAVEGSIGDFWAIPFVEGSATVTFNRPTQSPMHSQSHIDGHALEVFLPKSATLDFEINLETFPTKATNAVAAAQTALGYLFEVGLGGKNLSTGTTVNDASPGANINTMTAVTGWAEGGAFGLATGTGSTLEVREIEDITSLDVTTKHAFTGAPSNGATAYGAATYYMDGTDGSETKSLQVAFEGLYTGDRWLLKGGQLAAPPKFSLGIGGIPKVSFSWQFAWWGPADGSSTTMNLQTGTLGHSTYTENTLVHFDSEFRQQTVGTATIGSLIHASDIQFELGVSYAIQRSSAGTNTIVQYIRDRNDPTIRGSFLCPFEDLTWRNARDNKTLKDLMLQIGTATATGAIYIVAPTVQIVDVQLENQDGIAGQRVSWVGLLDQDVADGTPTDLGYSCFRIHMV